MWLYSARFYLNYFREQYLQSLISDNLTLSGKPSPLVNTQDTAGLYALLKQGETGVQLQDLMS